MKHWFSNKKVDGCESAEINKTALMDTSLDQKPKNLTPETSADEQNAMVVDESHVDISATPVTASFENDFNKSVLSKPEPANPESNIVVPEASEHVESEEAVPSVEGNDDSATAPIDDEMPINNSGPGSKSDESTKIIADESTEMRSPSQASDQSKLNSSASEPALQKEIDPDQVIAQIPTEPNPPVELEQQTVANISPDYNQQFLDNFASNGFTPQSTAKIMVQILDFALSLRAELDESQHNNQALHNNMVILENHLTVSNQNHAILASAHEDFIGEFAKFQKRQSQREIRKDIEDAKKELAAVTSEVKKLREPDIKIEHLSKQVKLFETRFQKMEEEVAKEIKASKEARAGVIKEKKKNTDFAKNMDGELTNLREEVNEINIRIDSMDERTDLAAKEAVEDAQATSHDMHQRQPTCVNVDEITLVKEELTEIRQELTEGKQERQYEDNKLRNDLDVLRDHVTEWIQTQGLDPKPNTFARSGSVNTRNNITHIFTPAPLATLKSKNSLMSKALVSIIEGQDEKNAEYDEQISSLGKRTRSCWEAIHTLNKQSGITYNLATNTANAVNKVIKATAAQARRVEEGLDSLDDRVVALAKPGGEPKEKKQCLKYVGDELERIG